MSEEKNEVVIIREHKTQKKGKPTQQGEISGLKKGCRGVGGN